MSEYDFISSSDEHGFMAFTSIDEIDKARLPTVIKRILKKKLRASNSISVIFYWMGFSYWNEIMDNVRSDIRTAILSRDKLEDKDDGIQYF